MQSWILMTHVLVSEHDVGLTTTSLVALALLSVPDGDDDNNKPSSPPDHSHNFQSYNCSKAFYLLHQKRAIRGLLLQTAQDSNSTKLEQRL